MPEPEQICQPSLLQSKSKDTLSAWSKVLASGWQEWHGDGSEQELQALVSSGGGVRLSAAARQQNKTPTAARLQEPRLRQTLTYGFRV